MSIEKYFRKTIANPEGSIVHDGDCRIFSTKICTCGLLHYLMPIENASKIYEKYEEEIVQHEQALSKLTPPERL